MRIYNTASKNIKKWGIVHYEEEGFTNSLLVVSVISQTKSALRCSEIRSKEIPDLAFSIPPLHQYCAISRPVRYYYITTESKTKMLPHEPVHQQLYYLWPLHTYINRISVILTLCYFYMNTKEVRYVIWTRHRLSWVGLGWKGEHWWGESDAWGGQDGG